MKRTSPRPPMKLCTTSSDSAADRHVARASWPLSEPALAYFPNARSGFSGRDLGAGALVTEVAMSENSPGSGDHGHVPVLLDRCVELLTPALTRQNPDGGGAVLVDATLGAGGHSERFLTEFPGLRVIGLDRDPNALWIAGERLSPFGDRVMLVRTRYDGIGGVLAETGYWADKDRLVEGILFDLGVSSMQLDRTERGFSYSVDAPLDMRMDPDAALTAAEVLNTYDEKVLSRGLREFGEERFASRIAKQIVHRPSQRPFSTPAVT